MLGSAKPPDAHDDTDLSVPFHFLSHADLLCFPQLSGKTQPSEVAGSVVDAIIVPTIREAGQLRPAVDLAAQLGCPLIAIYSQRSDDELSSIKAEFKQSEVTVIGLPANLPQDLQELLDFETNSHAEGVSSCPLDISRKRNLGLAMAQLCGWTKILFLDDDIRHITSEKVIKAARLLDKCPVVGLQVRNYPDNSVVGHAKRLAGWNQDVFISGGSLLVDPQRLNGFFPPVYHEDWFCSLNHICAGTAAVGGEVEQLPYAPFATPMRAWLEEFADILSEGLLWLIHHKMDLSFPQASFWAEAMDSSFWHSALQRRAMLLDEIARRLHRQQPDNSDVAAALVSVKQAQTRRSELAAEDFVTFVDQWLRDLAVWRARLAELPRVDSVAMALTALGLSRVVFAGDPEPRESPDPEPRESPDPEPRESPDPESQVLPTALTQVRRWPTRAPTTGSVLKRGSLGGILISGILLSQGRRLRERLGQLR
jgi:hypothetical protein